MSIKLQNVEVDYRKLSRRSARGPAAGIFDVDLNVDAGETIAVIGKSGAGKTTLMRALCGLVPLTKGEAEIAGHTLGPYRRMSRDYRHDVGIVFQDYGLVGQLSALQNVLCGSLHRYAAHEGITRFEKKDIERAIHLLQELGLQNRMHLRCSRLSGGEKQRVAIARLLLQNPKVVLLDEPISGLDIHWTRKVLALLDELHEGKATKVLVLHDLNMVREMTTRAIVVDDGAIIFDGPSEQACKLLEASGDEIQGPAPTLDVTTTPRAAPRIPAWNDRPGLGRMPFYLLIFSILIGGYVWSARAVNFSVGRIFENKHNALDFLRRTLPPDFDVSKTIMESILETVQMALVGTTLAAIISLPLAVLAARNLSPAPVRGFFRLVLNLLRTIPSIIWGLFFVAMVGLGPFPGILALTFYASGYLGKFYYEGIESIDPQPALALKTVGASGLHRFRYAIFPQVLPLLIGYTLYMFEYNIRAASILGVVGAGGVGFYLYTYINNFQYPKAATAIAFLLIVVTVIDWLSSQLRTRLMD